MSRAHEAPNTKSAATGASSRYMWLAVPLLAVPGIIISGYAQASDSAPLTAAGLTMVIAALGLLTWSLRAWQRRADQRAAEVRQCIEQIHRNAVRIDSYYEALSLALRHGLRPGHDGAAACPLGGGESFPQVSGQDVLMGWLDTGPAANSHPG